MKQEDRREVIGKDGRKKVVIKKRVPRTKPTKKRGNNRRLALIIAINCLVLGLLGGGMCVTTHYLLQSGTRHGARAVVPDFQTLTMDQAESIAAKGDFKLVVNDSIYVSTRKRGSIIDQIPKEGTIVKPGRTIYVTVNATQQKRVDVPYVAGRSLRQAKSMLEVASLTIKELIYEEDIATNYILAQYCNGEEVKSDSKATAIVGTGITLKVGVDEAHNEVAMPLLIGKALYIAQNSLLDIGLNVGETTSEKDIAQSDLGLAWIMSQSIPSDSLIKLGTKIDLELTQDRSLVDTVLFYREKMRLEAEELLLQEQAIADSLAMIMVDSTELIVEEVKPKRAEKVEFEDLFN